MDANPEKVGPLTSIPRVNPKSIHIKTFGCQMNVYDSERMQSLLLNSGYRFESELKNADVIILNTCSIRDKSEHKVLSLLGQLKPIKDKAPHKILGVSGCVGQRLGRSLLQRVPHLDLVLGPDGVDRVISLVDKVARTGERIVDAKFDELKRTYSQPAVVHRAKPSEFLTIMKGCDHFCTYCIVPFVRGRETSRPIAEIIEDVKKYVALGTKEVVFLGQNINTYGKGTAERLSHLVEQANAVAGLERIRYVTSHPRDLGEDLIGQFGKVEKLCPALHLPFQSGSNAVLKRMSRLYTKEEYLGKVDLLREACPTISLSTDVIIGFPGETDSDFEETLEVLEKVKFSLTYLFKYSPRPGTRAFGHGEEIAEEVKEERFRMAHRLTNKIILEENETYVGKVTPVLVESIDKKGRHFFGRNPEGKIVHVHNANETCIGRIIPIEITEASSSNLRGLWRAHA